MEVVRIDLMQLKEKHFENIEPKSAIRLCEESLHSYPDDPHILFLLARAYTKAKQYTKGFSLASKACQKGDIGGCTLLGGYYDTGLIPKKISKKKSTLVWLWSCFQQDSQACTNLYSNAMHHGTFIPIEIEKSIDLLELCSRGDYPLACHTYAKNCFRDNIHSDECRYASSRSCIAGIEEGCLFYRDFRKTSTNKSTIQKEQFSIYKKSCNNGNIKSCLHIAHIYGSKKRTKINNIMALALYEDGCTKGHDATSCRYAGAYYLAALEGITQNIPLGLSYLKSSCTPRTTYIETPNHSSTTTDYDILGCLDLAKYYLNAPKKEYRNKENAKKTLKQACKLSQYYYTSKLGCQLGVSVCCQQIENSKLK
jgi:TPR repeat protein